MPSERATQTARAIADDRAGADYYRDPEILTQFLEGSLAVTREVAESLARTILDDRAGADYYRDPEILAGILDGAAASG